MNKDKNHTPEFDVDGRCTCTCASTCPLGKTGMQTRCTKEEILNSQHFPSYAITFRSSSGWICKERPGVISPEAVWVAHFTGYLYVADTLEQLFALMSSEWKHDKHLVG